MTRDRIVMIKRAVPKRVRLPNGRTFFARYKQATRDDLPANVNLNRPYKQRNAPKGKRQQQQQQHGRGFKNVLGKIVKFAKKVGKNKTFRKIARSALEEAPGLVQNLSKKTKNKRIKALLDNDYTKTGLDLAAGYAIDKLK